MLLTLPCFFFRRFFTAWCIHIFSHTPDPCARGSRLQAMILGPSVEDTKQNKIKRCRRFEQDRRGSRNELDRDARGVSEDFLAVASGCDPQVGPDRWAGDAPRRNAGLDRAEEIRGRSGLISPRQRERQRHWESCHRTRKRRTCEATSVGLVYERTVCFFCFLFFLRTINTSSVGGGEVRRQAFSFCSLFPV